MTHNELVRRAEKWLKSINCGVVFRDAFRAYTESGEQPDAIGWRSNVSILIECKTSRADFLADKNKVFRRTPGLGMGDWRFYLCPPGIIQVGDLPKGWGLLYATPKTIQKIHGVPSNARWINEKPFIARKESEVEMMYSALRRMTIRGHIDAIYDRLPTEDKTHG